MSILCGPRGARGGGGGSGKKLARRMDTQTGRHIPDGVDDVQVVGPVAAQLQGQRRVYKRLDRHELRCVEERGHVGLNHGRCIGGGRRRAPALGPQALVVSQRPRHLGGRKWRGQGRWRYETHHARAGCGAQRSGVWSPEERWTSRENALGYRRTKGFLWGWGKEQREGTPTTTCVIIVGQQGVRRGKGWGECETRDHGLGARRGPRHHGGERRSPSISWKTRRVMTGGRGCHRQRQPSA